MRAAIYNNQILVVGGFVGSSEKFTDEVSLNTNKYIDPISLIMLQIYEYDPKAESWSVIADLQMPRSYHTVTEVDFASICLGKGKSIMFVYSSFCFLHNLFFVCCASDRANQHLFSNRNLSQAP